MASVLPQKRLSKAKKLQSLNALDLFPINDLEAFQQFPNHQWVYNRLLIAQMQGLPANPMPIEPLKHQYPVFLKPIINLYGLTLKCYQIRNQEEFYNHWYDTGFWTTYLEGEHTSTDLVIDEHSNILWSVTFRGHLRVGEQLGKRRKKKKITQPGVYDYWELINDYRLPASIYQLVKKMNDPFELPVGAKPYRGIINVECIGGYISEVHLRPGDLDQLVEVKVLRSLVDFYRASSSAWSLGKEFHLHQIYLVPVFVKVPLDYQEAMERKEALFPKVTDELVQMTSPNCLFYEIDSPSGSHPPGYKRIVMLTTNQLEAGFQARDRILELLSKAGEDFASEPGGKFNFPGASDSFSRIKL